MSRSHGLDGEDLRDLAAGRRDRFSAAERAAIAYATEMTQTRVEVDDELFARLREHYTEPQIVELTAAIAWENYRARFNHALGFESEGFSEGDDCPLPAPGSPSVAPGGTH